MSSSKHMFNHLMLHRWIKYCVICVLLVLSIVPYGRISKHSSTETLDSKSYFFIRIDPYTQHLDARLQKPSWNYWLGTDFFGRNIFSRLVLAIGNTLSVSIFAVGAAISLGLFLAIVVSSMGNTVLSVSEIIVDIVLAIPVFLVCLVLVSLYGSNKAFIIVGQCIAFIPLVFRASIQDIRFYMKKEYIVIARSFGMSNIHIIIKHVFPFLIPKLFQQLTSLISIAIGIEAGLSYLGFGIAKPEPSVGNMLFDAKSIVGVAPWYMLSVLFSMSFLLVCVQLLVTKNKKHIV